MYNCRLILTVAILYFFANSNSSAGLCKLVFSNWLFYYNYICTFTELGYQLVHNILYAIMCLNAVTLTSSADRVCPGDTVVFTCVTDTLPLIWTYNGLSKLYNSPNQVNETNTTLLDGAFNIQLNTTTVGFVSNAVATSISLNYDGTKITCSDTTNIDREREKIKQINIGLI